LQLYNFHHAINNSSCVSCQSALYYSKLDKVEESLEPINPRPFDNVMEKILMEYFFREYAGILTKYYN